MSRLAIPLYGDHVAPRFVYADQILICGLGSGRDADRYRVTLNEASGPARLRRLASMGVSVLLCAGFNRTLDPVARSLGIEVVWGLVGTAEHLIEAYRDGTIDRCRLASPRPPEEI